MNKQYDIKEPWLKLDAGSMPKPKDFPLWATTDKGDTQLICNENFQFPDCVTAWTPAIPPTLEIKPQPEPEKWVACGKDFGGLASCNLPKGHSGRFHLLQVEGQIPPSTCVHCGKDPNVKSRQFIDQEAYEAWRSSHLVGAQLLTIEISVSQLIPHPQAQP